jgi:hypothetical protein
VRFSTALHRALTRADEGNWRRRLDDLHAEQGTWPRVAAELDISAATLRRYRAGGYRGRAGRWRPLAPDPLYPRITRALRRRRGRAAAIGRADFKRLRVKGTWLLNDTYTRRQVIYGKYMSDESVQGLSSAYLSGNGARVDRAWDNYLSTDYVDHLSTARMLNTEWLEI